MTQVAMFTPDGSFYLPSNKNATAVCAILSKMKLNSRDLIEVRKQGYTPILTNGIEIGQVDVKA